MQALFESKAHAKIPLTLKCEKTLRLCNRDGIKALGSFWLHTSNSELKISID